MKKKPVIYKSAYVLSIIICGLYSIGIYAKETVINGKNTFDFKSSRLFLMVCFLLASVVFGILFSYAFKKLDEYHGEKTANENTNVIDFINFKACMRLMLMFIIAWIPYIIIRFPGNYDHDTITQLVQGYEYANRTDHHPFFDTMFFYIFWRLGDVFHNNGVSLFVYMVFQYIATSYAAAFTLIYFEKIGLTRKIKKILTAFFAFFPIIPIFAQVMTKDCLYAWIFMLYVVYFYELVRTSGKVLKSFKYMISFMVILLFLMLTKKTGIYLNTVVAVIGLIGIKKYRLRAVAVYTVPTLLFAVVWSKILLPYWNVEEGGGQELMSVPSQQVGYIIKERYSELSEEEWSIINGVYNDAASMGNDFNPILADAMKIRWINKNTKQKTNTFYKWYLKQYIKYPKEMILSVFALDNALVTVDTDSNGTQSMLFFWDNVTTYENASEGLEFMGPNIGTTGEQVHEMIYTSYRHPVIGKISDAFDSVYLHLCDSFAFIFCKALYASWIPLFAVFYAIHRKDITSLLGLSIIVVTTLILVVGPTTLPRYMPSSVYATIINIATLFVPVANKPKSAKHL